MLEQWDEKQKTPPVPAPATSRAWRIKLEPLMRNGLILAMFAAVWLPSLGTIAGLTLRISQVGLVIILIYLFTAPHVPGINGWAVPYTPSLIIVWSAFLFWTLLNIALGTLQLHGDQSPVGSVGRVLLFGSNLLIYGAAYLMVVRFRQLEPILRMVAISGALMGILSLTYFGLLQIGITLPEELAGITLEPVFRAGVVKAEYVTRLAGGPNKATFLAGTALICLIMALNKVLPVRSRIIYIICGACALMGSALGIARSALLALAVGIFIWLVFLVQRGRLVTVISSVLISVMVVSLSSGFIVGILGSDNQVVAAFLARAGQFVHTEEYFSGTAGNRLDLWGALIDDVLTNPLWGNGMDGYQRHYPEGTNTTENFLLEVLHATGLWGFLPMMLVVSLVIWRGWRTCHRPTLIHSERMMLLALLCAYVGILAGSLTNSLWGGGLFWMFLGMLVGATHVFSRQATQNASLSTTRKIAQT